MNLPVFFLLFSLALLCALCWSHRGPAQSRAEASVHSRLPCVLKPRCPDDCPACRLASTASSGAGPVPAPVRPWREVKSRRGAPKRINTEGFACPNRECLYFGITESHIHALVGDGKHGQAERIQTFRGPACHTTFSARRHTPLYRLKTPSHQVAMVRITRWPRDWTHPPPNGSQGYRQATISTWLSRESSHAQTLHERTFRILWLPHLQLDELRTRLRSANQMRLPVAGD